LFNGVIPLAAIQMNAIKFEDLVTLVCTTVLDQRVPGSLVEDEEEKEVTDRSYWEKRGTRETVRMADDVLKIIKTFDQAFELKYNKFYIGLARDGEPCNFVIFRAQKQALRMEPRLQRDDAIETKLNEAGLDVMDYSTRNGRYRIRLAKGDIDKHAELLTEILAQACRDFGA
jgi:hypothetical protein